MWLQTCEEKPFKNFGDVIEVIEIGRKLAETDGSWIQTWLF